MSTSVKHIHSGMRGAPVINGQPGTLIAALDAFFTSGWGLTTALSVSVSGGVATASLTPGETFDRDAVVLVVGATPGALNGASRVLSSSNTSITWATSAPDGAASGTITIRYAPQSSWVKLYGATNKAVYRSAHVQAHGHFLRVDDTTGTSARVIGYESMSDVDSGVGPFPTPAQSDGGGYWRKSAVASATPVRYAMFSDERLVILAIASNSSANSTHFQAHARGFGDPVSLSPSGDVWSSLLSFDGASDGNSYGSLDSRQASTSGHGTVMARAFSGLGGSAWADPLPLSSRENSQVSGANDFFGAIPSEVDGQIKPSRIFMKEQGAGKPPRAWVPGVLFLPHTGAGSLLVDREKLDGSGDLAGRRLMVVATSFARNSLGVEGRYLVDVTGPWR